MDPGDLVTSQKTAPVYSLEKTSAGSYYYLLMASWDRGDVGILLDGIDLDTEMVQALLNGQIVWIAKNFLVMINDDVLRQPRMGIEYGQEVINGAG